MRLSRIPLIILVFFVSISGFSQSSENYEVNTFTNGSLLADKNGNSIDLSGSPNLVPNTTYYVNSNLVEIGFDFMFMGKSYTHFIAGSNGQLGLAVENTPAYALHANVPNQLRKSVAYPPVTINSSPVIAPFWDMLMTARSGATIREGLFGNYPNRCAVIQWNVVIGSNSTTNPFDGVFQVRLYERTGEIEFVYGKMSIGPSSQLVTASVGFTAGPSTNHFIAVKELTNFSVTRNSAEESLTRELVNSSTPGNITGLHSTVNGSGRRILFVPDSIMGQFTSSGIIRQLATSMQLNWSDNFTNKLGYLIYKSEGGGTNYTLEASLPPSSTSYVATGLQPTTIYQWMVVPYTEGNLKKELVLIDSTRCSMGSDYTIGPSGDFVTIQSAIDSLLLWGIKAPVKWELQPDYSFSSETLPIRFKKHPCMELMHQITIQPAVNASFHFVNNTTGPVFLLDSMSNIIIDGRAGGTGGIALSFEGSGEIIKISNSSDNQIQYVEFKSGNNLPGFSPFIIESTSGTGSQRNKISNCHFHDRGPAFNLPRVMISGRSTNDAWSHFNHISNNLFYNFRSFAIDADGQGWQINNNSFYATQAITATDSSGFIRLSKTDNPQPHFISGNYFGGSDPTATGNALHWNVATNFSGIEVCGSANITNNRFRRLNIAVIPGQDPAQHQLNIILTGKTGATTNYTSNFNITGNYFGDSTIADSIELSGSNNFFGMHAAIIANIGAGATDAQISGNRLVNIHTNAASTELDFSLIYSAYGSTITNNIIGSVNHAVRIEHRGTGQLIGVHVNGSAVIDNNLITNIIARERIIGITNANNTGLVSNNTISHLKSLGGVSPNFFSVAGIANFSSNGVIESNRIFHMEDSSLIESAGPNSIFSNYSYAIIRKNLIDGLLCNQQSMYSTSMVAIETEDDHSSIENNMIRLGVDSAGNTAMKGLFFGFSNNYTSGHVLKHNTIYITGQNASPSGLVGSHCAAWFAGTTFMNNIFVNYRTISGTDQGNHIYLASDQLYPHIMDNNIYHQPPGIKFSSGANDFAAWVANPNHNHDHHSIFMAPGFINPEGPTRTLNLHLVNQTIAEGNGNSGYTTIDDYDGQVRGAYSPVDIGADAGNFTPIDIAPPNIYVTPLADAYDTVSRNITVHITDSISGIRLTGNTRPAIWYRKSYPVTTAWQYGYGLLESGNSINGYWKFFIDHASIGITEQGSDSVQYYFVAQDTTDLNISTNPENGIHTSVTQQISLPPQLYTYRVQNGGYIIPPVVNVGIGEHFESLTKDGGLFEGLGKDSVAHNSTVTVRITSHLFENGRWALDSLIAEKNIQVKIVPSYDSVFIIRNQINIDKAMIRLDKAHKIIFDGSFNGNGRWLRFINEHSSSSIGKSTISIANNCDTIVMSNLELQGNASIVYPPKGIIQIEGTNSNIIMDNNIFSNIPGAGSKPSLGIFCPSGSSVNKLTATNNHFVNLNHGGIYFNYGSKDVTIDSNHFYWNDAATHSGATYYGIYLMGFNTIHQVTNNYIGGSQPYCGGQPWTNTTAYQGFTGIYVLAQHQYAYSAVENNMVKNLRLPHQDGGGLYGIIANGRVIVNANTIGDSTILNSIETGTEAVGINTSGDDAQEVSNNLVAGIMVNDNAADPGSIYGIWIGADSSNVHNNLVRDLKITNGTPYSSNGTANGIYVGNNSKGELLEANEIFNIYSGSNTSVSVSGIRTSSAYNGGGVIKRNRIYNLTIPNSINGSLNGIYFNQNGSWTAENNQITLTNNQHPNSIHIYGFRDEATVNTENTRSIAYNSILIGGAQIGGNTQSYGWHTSGIGITQFFKNNLVINKRTGGNGHHGAIAIKTNTPATAWQPYIADYNFYVVNDTNRSFLWNSDTLSLSEWRSVTDNGVNSIGTLSSEINPTDLFANAFIGDLNINIYHPSSWYVNGKGIPVNYINDDFHDADVRSTLITTGASDIGSDEFNTSTTPPALIVFGSHQPGGSDTLYFNNDIVAVINWALQGTLPTINSARLHTGTWPNDLTNNNTIANARTMNAYLSIEASGGSNYMYNLVMYYDSSMLGTIMDASNMVINKKQSGVPGTWMAHPTVVTTNTLTVTGLNSFSEFTATDINATLSAGLPSPDLELTNIGLSSTNIATASVFHVMFTEVNNGTASATSHKVTFYLSQDNILTPGSNGDIILDDIDFSNLAGGGSTGAINHQLTMPCNIVAGNYFIFFKADGDSEVAETNENNNTSMIAVNILIGVSLPEPPTITTTPAASICAPGTITLTATSSGCTSCSYSWSTGENGTSITVNNSGNYSVTATNACGNSTSGQMVTINPQPVVSVVAAQQVICAGTSTQISASGADNYSWSPSTALSTTTGSNVIASPTVTTTYTVTGITNGCTMEKTITITVNPVPPTPVIGMSGNNLQSSASTGNQWYLNGVVINGATAPVYTPVAAGTYTVKVTINGCESFMSDGFQFIPTSINSPGLDKHIIIGPNPIENTLYIRQQGSHHELVLSVMDIYGKELLKHTFTSYISIDMKKYSAGFYILVIENKRKKERIQKIIFRK